MNEINRNHTNHARVVQDHDKPRLNLVELVAFCMSSVSGRFLMFIVGDVMTGGTNLRGVHSISRLWS